MKIIPVLVDNDYLEKVPYKDPEFPIDIFTDNYDSFIDETLNIHWHPQYEFTTLISGSLDFNITGIHMHMSEGDCLFINSNKMHTARQKPGFRGSVNKGVAFPVTLIVNNVYNIIYKKYFEPVSSSSIYGIIIKKEEAFASEIASIILKINALNNSGYDFELSCIGLLIDLWRNVLSYISIYNPESMINNVNIKYEERMKKLLLYIHNNYADNITIDNLAEYANISRRECFRCFKQFTNMSPIDYINGYRLEHAAKLLLESNLSVTEISNASGFNNSSYFGKLFKNKFYISPGQYGKIK